MCEIMIISAKKRFILCCLTVFGSLRDKFSIRCFMASRQYSLYDGYPQTLRDQKLSVNLKKTLHFHKTTLHFHKITLHILKKTLHFFKKTLHFLKITLHFLKKSLNYLKKTLSFPGKFSRFEIF